MSVSRTIQSPTGMSITLTCFLPLDPAARAALLLDRDGAIPEPPAPAPASERSAPPRS